MYALQFDFIRFFFLSHFRFELPSLKSVNGGYRVNSCSCIYTGTPIYVAFYPRRWITFVEHLKIEEREKNGEEPENEKKKRSEHQANNGTWNNEQKIKNG